MFLPERFEAWYRRSGADLPFGDPRPSHGSEMEGYFWRVTDKVGGRVLVVLCGVNRHPDGDWATIAVALHPGGFVHSAVVPDAHSATDKFFVTAGDGMFVADADHVQVDLGPGARVDFALDDQVEWPRMLGGGGVFSVLPFLGQYWHPHVLGGLATGTAEFGDERWEFAGGDIYAEKNWGAGFPKSWWWGQAQGFGREDVCVAFSGGVLTAGPVSVTVGGIMVRIGAHIIRLTPPTAIVRSHYEDKRWEISGRGHGYRVSIVGTGVGDPHVLPVPVPAERRNADTDFEYLAGHLTLEVSGRLRFSGETHFAALEYGYRPPDLTPAENGAPGVEERPDST